MRFLSPGTGPSLECNAAQNVSPFATTAVCIRIAEELPVYKTTTAVRFRAWQPSELNLEATAVIDVLCGIDVIGPQKYVVYDVL